MPPRHAPRRLRALRSVAGPAGLTLALAACSGSDAGSGRSGTPAPGAAGAGGHTAAVTITAAGGCRPDRTEFAAGGLTVNVTNKDATAVSEIELLSGSRIIGEKENLPPGFGGSFAVNVNAGTYTLYCPGATPEKTTITVTGSAAGTTDSSVAALLAQGSADYARYVSTQVGNLLAATEKLAGALHGTDLGAAQAAYQQARPFYEKIEPVAESFAIGSDDIDADIDAREGDVPAAQWRGFHRIEKGLFQARSLAGLASVGERLVADVAKLQKLTTGLTYHPTELANGAQELLDEVAASKITGEEERYSHIDLLDVAYNDEGAEQAFAQLEPALRKIDPTLAEDIAAKFAALDNLVDTYRTTANPSGFVSYAALTAADKKQLAAAVKAVQEPLSKVASKVADA